MAQVIVTEPRYRLLVLCAHPVQYTAPLFRRLAQHPRIDLLVAYCSLRGAEEGHDPEFGTMVKWDVPLLDGYRWVHISNKGSGDDSFFGLTNPGAWGLIRDGKFDAVLCYTGYIRATFWISYFASKISGTAFLFGTDAATLFSTDGAAWKKPMKKLAWPFLFRLASQVVAASPGTVELMRSLGIPNNQITLTPFVVDNEWWKVESSQVDRVTTREAWGLTESQLVVLYCAKLQSWKRPKDLLRAFARANIGDAVLIYVGEGPLRKELEKEASDLGIAKRVRFLGFANQTQLPAIYSSSDLFVLPSGYDACPVVVCEAMLCGLPVLLSDEIRGRFNLVLPGKTGDIFRCGDVEALAGALQNLLADRAALGVMSENAKIRMESWSPQEWVSGTLEAVIKGVGRVRGSVA
jgi:glycosyltransferase involved in cell wall biosynthesis